MRRVATWASRWARRSSAWSRPASSSSRAERGRVRFTGREEDVDPALRLDEPRAQCDGAGVHAVERAPRLRLLRRREIERPREVEHVARPRVVVQLGRAREARAVPLPQLADLGVGERRDLAALLPRVGARRMAMTGGIVLLRSPSGPERQQRPDGNGATHVCLPGSPNDSSGFADLAGAVRHGPDLPDHVGRARCRDGRPGRTARREPCPPASPRSRCRAGSRRRPAPRP